MIFPFQEKQYFYCKLSLKKIRYAGELLLKEFFITFLSLKVPTHLPKWLQVKNHSESNPGAPISVTRWLNFVFSIWPFTTMKTFKKQIKFTKVSSKFCKIPTEPFQHGQILVTSCQSGEISPNLVTLAPINKKCLWSVASAPVDNVRHA